MKRLVLAISALSALAAAGAASAQPYVGHDYYTPRDDYGYGRSYDSGEAQRLEQRIDWAARSGQLSWREAQGLRMRVSETRRLEWRYGRDGLSSWERREIDRRYDEIRVRLRFERNDRDSRYGGHGYGYGEGRWR